MSVEGENKRDWLRKGTNQYMKYLSMRIRGLPPRGEAK